MVKIWCFSWLALIALIRAKDLHQRRREDFSWMLNDQDRNGNFPMVRLPGLGNLRGVASTASAVSFLGVPYASPPLGRNRFMPPGDPDGWEGVRLAAQSGPACPRTAAAAAAVVGRRQDEDCLYLDVHVPAEAGGEGFHPIDSRGKLLFVCRAVVLTLRPPAGPARRRRPRRAVRGRRGVGFGHQIRRRRRATPNERLGLLPTVAEPRQQLGPPGPGGRLALRQRSRNAKAASIGSSFSLRSTRRPSAATLPACPCWAPAARPPRWPTCWSPPTWWPPRNGAEVLRQVLLVIPEWK